MLALPHLGASTAEAEEKSAAMAADQIRDFLEHGVIRNSVNFPDTQLPRRSSRCASSFTHHHSRGKLALIVRVQKIGTLRYVSAARHGL